MVSQRSDSVPRLAWERRRNALSLAIAAGVTVVTLAIYAIFVPLRFTVNTVAISTLVFWINYSVSVIILTHWIFTPLDHQTLRAWLQAVTPSARKLPTVNVQWSLLATASIGMVFILPGLLDSPLANALSFAVVISAWLVTVSSYAVHYGQLNSLEHSIDLPGKADGPVSSTTTTCRPRSRRPSPPRMSRSSPPAPVRSSRARRISPSPSARSSSRC